MIDSVRHAVCFPCRYDDGDFETGQQEKWITAVEGAPPVKVIDWRFRDAWIVIGVATVTLCSAAALVVWSAAAAVGYCLHFLPWGARRRRVEAAE